MGGIHLKLKLNTVFFMTGLGVIGVSYLACGVLWILCFGPTTDTTIGFGRMRKHDGGRVVFSTLLGVKQLAVLLVIMIHLFLVSGV